MNTKLFLLLTFLITSVIIFSWFPTRTFISNSSEENLSFVDFERTAKHVSTSWFPVGTGAVNIFEFVRFPYLTFLSLFQKVGVAPFLIQAMSLWIIMFSGVVFMYLLLNKGLRQSMLVSVLGSFFYLFNLYSMTQVWKRNIYQGFSPWAYLPLFIFLWIKWLDEGKIYWLIMFAGSMSVFSHAFAHPGYFFVYLVVAGVYAIFKFIQNRKNIKNFINVLLRCILSIILAVLINIWWIYPLIHNSTAQGATLARSKGEWMLHLDSLDGVSKYFGTTDILLLRQKAYFEKESALSTEWFDFYNNFFAYLISLSVLAIMVLGIIKEKTQRYFKYLFTLLLIGWFVSKGSNFPLGGRFFSFLFANFTFTAALRNPYEKFGLVFLLPYTIFFALGLSYIFGKFKNKRGWIIRGILIALFYVLLVYPMWNGDIFPPKHRLTIPAYYTQTNDYLNLNSSQRTFHVPFSLQAELLKYSWGYIGQDPTENIFDSQNVSRSTIPTFSSYYELIPKYVSQNFLPRLLGLLGVDHIILHHDMIYPQLNLNTTTIDQWREISKAAEFGPLTLYRLDKNIVKPEIFAATSLVEFDSIQQALDRISKGEFNITKSVFINTDNVQLTQVTDRFAQVSDSSVDIAFEKKSPTRFQVQVEARAPFVLVLNDTFNSFWEVKIDKQVVDKHFLVNGFANGWIIDKEGNYFIDIVFKVWPWE